VARLRGDDDLARLRHGVGDHAAHRVVGAGGAASADAKELLRLRGADEGQRADGGGDESPHARGSFKVQRPQEGTKFAGLDEATRESPTAQMSAPTPSHPVLPAARCHPLQSTAACRAIEHTAATALPPHTLMARAGEAVARLAMAIAPHARSIEVWCGPGN